jgi:hypothetical protein
MRATNALKALARDLAMMGMHYNLDLINKIIPDVELLEFSVVNSIAYQARMLGGPVPAENIVPFKKRG